MSNQCARCGRPLIEGEFALNELDVGLVHAPHDACPDDGQPHYYVGTRTPFVYHEADFPEGDTPVSNGGHDLTPPTMCEGNPEVVLEPKYSHLRGQPLGSLPMFSDPKLLERTLCSVRGMVIKEGRDAYNAGLPVTKCPLYQVNDLRLDWQNGWRWEKEEHEARAMTAIEASAAHHKLLQAREALADDFAKAFPAIRYSHLRIVAWFIERLSR